MSILKLMNTHLFTAAISALVLLQAPLTHAKETKKTASEITPAAEAGTGGTVGDIGAGGSERVNVENIKQKYWARGDESELGVVQNRTYSKDKKFEIGLFGGLITTDPFLSVKNTGASLGFHFSEYVEAKAFGYKSFVGPSSALDILRAPLSEGGLGTNTNTNDPKWYFGAEAAFSPIYGKLSVLGKAIIHYDLHVLGGLGVTGTESGNYVSPHVGIGQQIYLTQRLSLALDYRLMIYSETIREKVRPSAIGQDVGKRTNFTNTITLGLNFLFDPFGKKPAPIQQ
jgi:outer membrane beta-barrel protein